jgi:glucose-1-phosphate thymidylyltransferase
MGHELLGLVPAGGLGKRIYPLRLWKELIPVGYKECVVNNEPVEVPKVIAEYTVENMVKTGAKRLVFVVNEQKAELVRFFGQGFQYNTSIAYVCQEANSPYYGMPIAINTTYPWIKDQTVMMGMPDTIIEPSDCFIRVLKMHKEKKADLTLGVFPTSHPHRLDPVAIQSGTAKVEMIYGKPKTTSIFNTWGIAVWNSNFTNLLHAEVENYIADPNNQGKEMILCNLYNLAIAKGLAVYGLFFPEGIFYDLGNITEFVALKNKIEVKSAL